MYGEVYPYVDVFLNKGKMYNLIDLKVPSDANFLILESLVQEKSSQRMIHVISIPRNISSHSLKLGRGHESDIRVSDISVSRCHAFLKFQDGDFYIEDNSSKFGSLVLVREHIEIDPTMTMAVQRGRSVISFVQRDLCQH